MRWTELLKRSPRKVLGLDWRIGLPIITLRESLGKAAPFLLSYVTN